MRQSTKRQRGSKSRDFFKYLHKQLLDETSWALDCDLMLVDKIPVPFIVALFDIKTVRDRISFTEAIAYQQFISRPQPYRIPVYFIYANQALKSDAEDESLSSVDSINKAKLEHRFTVTELVYADHRPNPPISEERVIVENVNWQGLAAWETQLRAKRRQEMQKHVLHLAINK